MFLFLTLQAEEQDSSDVEISITIDKDVLARIVKTKSSVGFVEKIFNIGGDVMCGAGKGVVLVAAILLYNQTVVINNTPGVQGQIFLDTYKWNQIVSTNVVAGAVLGGVYGFLNGVYTNFVKS